MLQPLMTSSMKFMMKKQETLNVNQRPLTEVQLKDSYYRIVDYTADDVHGFQATVRREPLNNQSGNPQKLLL